MNVFFDYFPSKKIILPYSIGLNKGRRINTIEYRRKGKDVQRHYSTEYIKKIYKFFW